MSLRLWLRFYRSNSLILFCSLLHVHLTLWSTCCLLWFLESNWQNSHKFLLESVRPLNHSVQGVPNSMVFKWHISYCLFVIYQNVLCHLLSKLTCILEKELNLCHKLWFSNPNIFATQCFSPQIFLTKNYVRSNNLSLKY